MKRQRRTVFIFIIVLIASTLVIIQGARYRNTQHDRQQKIVADNDALIREVATQLNLPYTKPIIASVHDPVDFKNNSDLANLKKGDKIILYISSNEAILYRPSEKKILNVLPAKAVLRTKN